MRRRCPTPAVAASAAMLAWSATVVAADLETGGCPTSEAVWATLDTLIPSESRDQLRRDDPPVFEVVDHGVSYAVRAEGAVREYEDEARDCAQRARVAAIFVAVALEPRVAARIPTEAVRATTSPPAAPEVSSVQRLDLAGTLFGAPMNGGSPGAGAVLRWSYVRREWGVGLGVGWQHPWTQTFAAGSVKEERSSVAVGLQRRWTTSVGQPFLEAGGVAVRTRFEAVGLPARATPVTVEAGFYGMGGMRFGAGRVAPWITFGVRGVPSPTRIVESPAGNLGRAPYLWIETNLGLSLTL